jgi:uncharacterized membrane protein YdfJ with MMPL/SSD domain
MVGHLDRGVSSERAAAYLASRFRSLPAVAIGGSSILHHEFIEQIKQDLTRAEILAFPLLLGLALLVFRSVIAALLPILVSGLSLCFAFAALRAINTIEPISILSLDLVAGLSVGLSLDYSLLLVSRFREELTSGTDRTGATSATISSAGRTVAMSSITVAAAFGSTLVFPIGFLRSLALGGLLAAIVAAAVSLLVLPASFSLLAECIGMPRSRQRPGKAAMPDPSSGRWYRVARCVTAHPTALAIISCGALLAIGLPALGMRLSGVDGLTLLPASASSHRFDERIRNEFNQPLLGELIAVGRGDEHHIVTIATDYLETLPDVAGGEIEHVAGNLWMFDMRETATPFSGASRRLVNQIRLSPYGLMVSGATADYMDTAASLRSHLPVALIILLATSFVFLSVATGSVILPLKAVTMSGLSLAAGIGLLVIVFQEGRPGGLLVGQQGALDLVQPLLLGAGIYGISTDYEVFLLTRIKEGWDAGLTNDDAVAAGLARTGRVITSAALLFCVAVGSLLTSRMIFVKEAAFGMVAAVTIDASLVRVVLVPSLMTLLGRWNWWRPRIWRFSPSSPKRDDRLRATQDYR